MHVAPFEVASLVVDVAILMAEKAQGKPFAVMARIAPNLPRHVIGDSNQIRQILENLTETALKFTNQGYVIISVTGAS